MRWIAKAAAISAFYIAGAWGQGASGDNSDPVSAGRKRFQVRCAGCHGSDGTGGERAPAIGHGDRSKLQSERDIRELIRNGVPEAGMPAFPLPAGELDLLVAFVRSRVAPAARANVKGDVDAGSRFFFGEGRCSACHMFAGRGGITGPDLTRAGETLTAAEIETSLRNPDARHRREYTVATVRLHSGKEVRGFLRNESGFDVQLQGFDDRLHLLQTKDIAEIRKEPGSDMPKLDAPEGMIQNLVAFLAGAKLSGTTALPPKPLPDAVDPSDVVRARKGEWPTYHGNIGGNRHSELDQITPANVGRLAPKWMFPVRGARNLEVTPVVVGGVMYVTTVNTVYALDARSGRQIWVYTRPRSKDLVGDASGGINRGVAVSGDRVFVVTDNAHLLALHRINGALLWDVEMADSRRHYGATSAPLAINEVVISGVSGGDEGIRDSSPAIEPTQASGYGAFGPCLRPARL